MRLCNYGTNRPHDSLAELRRRGVVLLAALLLVCTLMAGAVSAEAWDDGATLNSSWYKDEIAAGHDGSTWDKALRIYNAKSLAELANQTNTNTSQGGFKNKWIRLESDIDLKSHPWTPIGNTTNTSKGTAIFKGKFDGGNKNISNLSIQGSSDLYVGFIGYLGQGTSPLVSNLTFVNASVTTTNTTHASSIGVAVGRGQVSDVKNIHVQNSVVSGRSFVGGIIGYGYVSIQGCQVEETNITATSPSPRTRVGGIAGSLCAAGEYSVTECSVTKTTILADGTDQQAGGLVGSANLDPNTAHLSFSKNTVTSTSIHATSPDARVSPFVFAENDDFVSAGGFPTSQDKVTLVTVTVGNSAPIIYEGDVTSITRNPADDVPQEPQPEPPQPQPQVSSGDGNMNNAFRVLFETQGGSFIGPATGLSYGDRVAEPATPVKDGYTFGGWYKDSACTQAWSFSDSIPGDMTLYAKWTSSGTAATATQTVQTTAKATTAPVPTQAQSGTTATTAAGAQPTLTQAPAPVLGGLFGLLIAGVLLRRRE